MGEPRSVTLIAMMMPRGANTNRRSQLQAGQSSSLCMRADKRSDAWSIVVAGRLVTQLKPLARFGRSARRNRRTPVQRGEKVDPGRRFADARTGPDRRSNE